MLLSGIIRRFGCFYIRYPFKDRIIMERVGAIQGNREFALRSLRERKFQIAEGTYVIPKERDRLFSNLALDYSERVVDVERLFTTGKSERTYRRRMSYLRRLNDFFGSMFLIDISTDRVAEYKQHRLKSVSPSTVYQEVCQLKSMFRWAIYWESRGRFLYHYGVFSPSLAPGRQVGLVRTYRRPLSGERLWV